MSLLVSLALIPLALAGACILFVVSWWLLPYAMVLFGGLLLVSGMSMDASQTGSLGCALAFVGVALSVVGGVWSRARYAEHRGRR